MRQPNDYVKCSMVASRRKDVWIIYEKPRHPCGYKARPVVIKVLRFQKNPRITSKGFSREDCNDC